MSLPSEAFLADVLTEPESLGALLDAYEGPGSPLATLGDVPERRVLFVGMGSSRYAALAACSRLRRRGIDAAVEYASAAAQTPPATDQLVVAISARGTTPETVEAAGRHRGEGRLVAVTNAPASPLGEAADIVLPLLAGEEAELCLRCRRGAGCRSGGAHPLSGLRRSVRRTARRDDCGGAARRGALAALARVTATLLRGDGAPLAGPRRLLERVREAEER